MVLRFVICLMLFNLSGLAQEKPSDFVLVHGKPWAYLRLDHVGPRKPLFKDEGEVGIWLRLVNNCRLPIKLLTMGKDPNNEGVVLLDEVVPFNGFTISSAPDLYPPKVLPTPPSGYWGRGGDILKVATVSPGQDILFSVPRNHIGKDWSLRLAFFLDVGTSSVPTGPPCYVEFSESELPKNPTEKGPVPPKGASAKLPAQPFSIRRGAADLISKVGGSPRMSHVDNVKPRA